MHDCLCVFGLSKLCYELKLIKDLVEENLVSFLYGLLVTLCFYLDRFSHLFGTKSIFFLFIAPVHICLLFISFCPQPLIPLLF